MEHIEKLNHNQINDLKMLVFIAEKCDEIIKKFFEIDDNGFCFCIDIRFTNKRTGEENYYKIDNIEAYEKFH